MSEIQKYLIAPDRLAWMPEYSQEETIASFEETDFSRQQIEEGKDFCYIFDKRYYTSATENTYYIKMAYSITQPDTLKTSGVFETVLGEDDTYHLYQLAVYREWKWIDKLPDSTVRIIEHEQESGDGVTNNQKKVNIVIKDLRLYDIILIEEATVTKFDKKRLLQPNFYRNIEIFANTYWAYANYSLRIINDRKIPISYKKHFFRDDKGVLLEKETGEIAPGETAIFEWKEYLNLTDTQREEFPFIDFVTQTTWEEIADFIVPHLQKVIENVSLPDFAAEFAQEIDALENTDKKIAFCIQYVQNQMRYIYDADEMDDYIPQSPAITWKNKQGDCKAKSALLKVMMAYIGVACDIILVNYRGEVFLPHYQPSPYVFNHMIVRMTFEGKEYFVDPTSMEEYGFLPYREIYGFEYYFPLISGATLQKRTGVRFEKYTLECNVFLNIENGVGTLQLRDVYRYHRANSVRRNWKNYAKREMIDTRNNDVFALLSYGGDPSKKDPRKIFTDVQVQIVSDDEDRNEVVVEYRATIPNAYMTDQYGKRFMMYFDNSILPSILGYNLEDIPYFHNVDRKKIDIHLECDEYIDQQEKYTCQECNLKNPYFTLVTKKDIGKYGGKMTIDYTPLSRVSIPKEDFQDLEADYKIAWDSNFGLGIDILGKGFWNAVKQFFGMK